MDSSLVPSYRVELVREGKGAEYGDKKINAPPVAAQVFIDHIGPADRENFVVLMLNADTNPVGINTVSVGSLNRSVVHPREVFKPAVVASADTVIFGHNHPSGNLDPSQGDKDVTNRLIAAGQVLGIEVLDHLVVNSDGEYVSMREGTEVDFDG